MIGCGMTRSLWLGDALGGERVAAGLGVCDHALEAAVERVPDALLGGGAALGVVVGGVDERGAAAQEHAVDLGDGEPLDVHDVGVAERQLGQAEGMLGHLQRHAQARAAEQAGRERVEDQAAAVALGLGHLPEAEAGGDQLHVLAARGQRRAEVMVVVGAAEAGRVGDDDAHRRRLPAATMPVNHTPKCG